jgi:hypothetical protein
VTDLPRRSYPLVVAPPGGFEDAVRRGRKRRRKQTGGSSAAALMLVGALAYSVVGHPGGGSDRLDQTHQPRIGQTDPLPYGGTSTPAPFSSSTPMDGHVTLPNSGDSGRGATTQAGTGTAPTAVPRASHSAAHPPRVKGRAYWPRPEVHFVASQTNLDANCLPAQDQEWCTTANGTPNGTYYHLTFSVCRSAVTGSDGVLNAHRKVPVDFQVLDVAHNDKVWTYSLGQAVVAQANNATVNAGECVQWWVDWDGYDDYGFTPPAGTYTVTGTLYSDEHLDPATSPGFQHD